MCDLSNNSLEIRRIFLPYLPLFLLRVSAEMLPHRFYRPGLIPLLYRMQNFPVLLHDLIIIDCSQTQIPDSVKMDGQGIIDMGKPPHLRNLEEPFMELIVQLQKASRLGML